MVGIGTPLPKLTHYRFWSMLAFWAPTCYWFITLTHKRTHDRDRRETA
jgi:hypothetical protein